MVCSLGKDEQRFHIRASLVFEDGCFRQAGSGLHLEQCRYLTFTMFICSHTRGSKYRAVGQRAPHLTKPGVSPSASLCFPEADKRTSGLAAGRLLLLLFFTSSNTWRPWTETHWWMFSFVFPFYFFSFSKRELYWNEILLIRKILSNKPAEDIFKYL